MKIIDRRACAFLQPDIAHSFGITNFIHIAHAAAQQQMLMAPHNAGGPIYFSALMHADAAIENLLIQEANCTWFRRFGEWAEHDWVVKDGFIELNDRPGLGLEIREEIVAAQKFDHSMDFRQYRHADGSWKGW